MRAVAFKITTRLYFADGSAQLVALSPREARADRHPAMVRSDDAPEGCVPLRSVLLRRHQIWISPDFIGPLESDDVLFVDDVERDIRQEPSRGGARIFAVFVEDGAPWLQRQPECADTPL